MDRQRDEWPNLDEGGGTGGPAKDTSSGEAQPSSGIARELQELGRQLANTARAAWQSEQRQEIQQELTDGIRLLRDQLNETTASLRTNPRAHTMTQAMKEQVSRAAETTRATELAEDVRAGMTAGLRELNDLLQRLTARLERREGGEHDAASAHSAVSSVGGEQTTPVTSQMTSGEYAGRTEPAPPAGTAGAVVGAGLMEEEPGLAPEQPIAGASQSQLERFGRGVGQETNRDQNFQEGLSHQALYGDHERAARRPDLPDGPEGSGR